MIQTEDGAYKVLRVTITREPPKKSLTTHFGGISVKWNTWACIDDTPTTPVWSGRSAVVERLLAHTCERCGSPAHLEVHHVRTLADLHQPGRRERPAWLHLMAKRRHKTLVVCRRCHEDIHAGRATAPVRK
jgi:hypothetical protein